ncbi:hypothetical protein AOLI_G00240930 [Acnodon oligacanthus]
MEGEFMEYMRTVTEFLDGKFSLIDELKIQVAWNRFQDHVKHLNQLLLTERMDRKRDRQRAERLRKLEKELWMAKEARLMSQMQQLRTDLALKDWQLDRATKMEETARKRAEKLKDREIQEKEEGGAQKNSKNTWTEKMTKSAEGLNTEHVGAQNKCIQEVLKVNDKLQNELLMKDEELEKMRRKLIEGQKKVKKIQNMSDELRSKNMEVSTKYMAMMKEKMKEREQEIIRDSKAAIKESEDRILSTVTLVVIKKHRLMQELQKRVSQCQSDNMSNEERQKQAKEPEMQKNVAKNLRKEASKNEKVKSKKRKSFWKMLCCCKQRKIQNSDEEAHLEVLSGE